VDHHQAQGRHRRRNVVVRGVDSRAATRNQEPRAAAPGSWSRLCTCFLILSCLTLVACEQTARRDAPRASAPTLEPLQPKGDTLWPFTFTWKTTAPAGSVFRVVVLDMAERPLLERETREGALAAPASDFQELLRQTRRFQWRVTLLDANGEQWVQTPLIEFTIR
jgi:hypothetical protein